MNIRRGLSTISLVVLIATAEGFVVAAAMNRWGAVSVLLLIIVVSACCSLTQSLSQAAEKLWALKQQWRWWHGCWLVLFLSGLVFRTRDVANIRDSPIDLWATYRIVLVGVVALVLIARLVDGKTWWLRSLWTFPICAISLYTVFSVASALWSVYPAWTLYKSLELFVDFMLVSAIVTEVRWSAPLFKSLFDWTAVMCIACIASVWLGVLFWPEKAVFREVGTLGVQIEGVFPAISPNGVGDIGAIIAIICCNRLLTRRPGVTKALYGVLLAVSLITLAVSQARSPIIGFVTAAAFVLLLTKHIGTIGFLSVVTVLLASLTKAGDILWEYIQRGQTPEAFQSLSGRVDWWSFGWQKILESPVIGHGSYAGARFLALSELGETSTSSIHNTYVEILLGTGFLGLILFLAGLAGIWFVIVRALTGLALSSTEQLLTVEATALLAYGIIRSFFTSALIWHPDLPFLQVLGFSLFLRSRFNAMNCRPVVHTATLPRRPRPHAVAIR